MEGETRVLLADGVATVLAAAAALPERGGLGAEMEVVEAAGVRGYFLPDEEELVKLRYSQYLTLRAALLATINGLGGSAGRSGVEWGMRLPLFATAFAAACVLLRANRFVVDLAAERPVLWKKLDEPDVAAGIPRKSFTALYKALSDPSNQLRFLEAAEFFAAHRGEVFALETDALMGPVVGLLMAEEPRIERRRREVVRRQLAYRWFSFVRRHRSAWKRVMGGMFEVSGRAIAEMRQPGVKPAGEPKRVHPRLRGEVLAAARPGDVFVTRHDDALSNWFLPGFWPHAALFLGSSEEAGAMVPDLPPKDETDAWFLESKKDGVKVRPAGETLAVDALVVLRPPLDGDGLGTALRRALGHRGKPYDFLFDFRTADRLVCTEVVYRGFHGIGPVRFGLRDVGGRLCLPAEEFLDQALGCGFRLALTAGLGSDRMLTGEAAMEAFRRSRKDGG
jgi:hypothetical protein